MLRAFDELCTLARQAALLESIEALLGWDERTYMPLAAGEYRAEQMTFISGQVHRRRTDPRIGELLAFLAGCELTKIRTATRRRPFASCSATTTSA